MDPHTASNLGLDDIRALVDDLIDAHADAMPAGIRSQAVG